ncbi:MAG: type 4a pilus biogenesis protein PilO [Polyangiaceae bacterium]|jgi:type IV pilus assembly protein PilO|nr:type 4a pilus biogenesis protein PilO [Polyangiaceae bacterium]
MAAKGTSALARLPTIARVGIGCGFLLLVVIAYFIILYSDVSSSVRAAKNEEGQLREKLANARKTEFGYQHDLAELNDRKQRQRELNKILPEDAAYPAFLSAIQGVANVTGISLTAWSPIEQAREEFYAKVPMKLALEGRFHQVAKFLHGVGQLDRIINVEGIALSAPKATEDETKIQVECTAIAFRALPTETAAPAGKTPAKDAGKKKTKKK